MRSRVSSFLFALTTAVLAAEPPAKERFVGTWKLISYELRVPSGEWTYPRGRDAAGRISYEASGRMTVQIMPQRRPKFANPDAVRGTSEEIQAAFRGYTAYYGTYTVDEKAGYVTHHVEASLFPNYIGTDQKRFFRFDGNRLTLEADLPAGRGRIVWERLP